MVKGTVKFFNFKNGFGFIQGDDGKDYFFSWHSLGAHIRKDKQRSKITTGARVAFDVQEKDKGPVAVHLIDLDENDTIPVE